MTFNSLFFLLTLVPLLGLYFVCPRKRSTALKLVVLLYSYFFYGMWNPKFLTLLVGSTVMDYWLARFMEQFPRHGKALVVLSLAANLGMLGFFKYCNFFLETFTSVLRYLGVGWQPPHVDVLLPVGISFYTFQTLSYTLDVYRQEIPARRSFLDVAFYVAFFPQLVAGPIVRASDFLPQIEKEVNITRAAIADGLFLVLCGLCLKMVMADNVGEYVNAFFENWARNSVWENWAAALLFGVQIYGDFAGYSLVAIGLARIMGYEFLSNFKAPYGALGFSDFWRRWHISLSTWLRDYLYIPLGGNRLGRFRTYLNLMATMLLGGLWHGASMMFVLWGGMHGAYLCLERFIRARLRASGRSIPWKLPVRLPARVLTYLAVSVTWIPFRAQTWAQCTGMLRGLVIGEKQVSTPVLLSGALALAVFGGHCACQQICIHDFLRLRPQLRMLAAVAMMLLLYYCSGEATQFIYFQF
jgi:alginate O-acetyltransferase complex protein AlgI